MAEQVTKSVLFVCLVAPKLVHSWCTYSECSEAEVSKPFKELENSVDTDLFQTEVQKSVTFAISKGDSREEWNGLFWRDCNICRSPIAEAVFRKLVTDQSISDHWRIDSAATSAYELGNPPDYRGQACMKKHGIPMSHVARQVTKEDFATFDYILCMDESNLRDLNRKSNQVKNCRAKIELLGSYDPQKQLIIEDPYYGNEADFETVYQQCVRCCRAFLEKVR